MGRYVDITGWIENGMWTYSSAYPGATIAECAHPPELPAEYEVYCQKFELGGQSGTYIETKAHVDPSARAVSECPVGDFAMEATVLRVPEKGANEAITVADLMASGVVPERDGAVILATGWDEHWHEPRYFVEGSPYIEPDAAHWLFAHRPRCVAADFPRFDYAARPCFPWAAFWAQVPYLLAPVCNVYQGDFSKGRLFAFPLKIRGAMGTPVRAVLEMKS